MKTIILLSISIISLIICLYPVKQTCGGRGMCAMPPQNPNELARYSYEVKPFFFIILNKLFGIAIPFSYSSGVEIKYKN